MRDFLAILKAWYEEVVESNGEYNCKGLCFVEGCEIKIPFEIVDEIVNNYYGTKELCDQLQEMLSERDDFIRLLRKENQELRELQIGERI